MVFATADGWALVNLVSAEVAGDRATAVRAIQQFTCITDIGDAMSIHGT